MRANNAEVAQLALVPLLLLVASQSVVKMQVYSEADFDVFLPAGAGRHVAQTGVKFGMEEWTFGGPLLHAKFHPRRCLTGAARRHLQLISRTLD